MKKVKYAITLAGCLLTASKKTQERVWVGSTAHASVAGFDCEMLLRGGFHSSRFLHRPHPSQFSFPGQLLVHLHVGSMRKAHDARITKKTRVTTVERKNIFQTAYTVSGFCARTHTHTHHKHVVNSFKKNKKEGEERRGEER